MKESYVVDRVTGSQGKGKRMMVHGREERAPQVWASGFGPTCSKVRYSPKKSAILVATIPVSSAGL